MAINNVYCCAVIVPTSVHYVQGWKPEVHIMHLTCTFYAPKFAKPVKKSVPNMLPIMLVAKSVQKLAKNVLRYVQKTRVQRLNYLILQLIGGIYPLLFLFYGLI
jgi:hypothetical protein